MKRLAPLPAFLMVFLLPCLPVQAQNLPDNLGRHLDELDHMVSQATDLAERLTDRLSLLHTHNRLGLGWYQGSATSFSHVGNLIDGYKAFATPDYLGIEAADGSKYLGIHRVPPAADGLRWLYFRDGSQSEELEVDRQLHLGINEEGEVEQLAVDLPGPSRLEVQGGGYLFRTGVADAWYSTIPYGDGVSQPYLSPGLIAFLTERGGLERPAAADYLRELMAELGHSYALSILLAGVAEQRRSPTPWDGGQHGFFAANHLRRLTGYPSWQKDERLELAALNHSRSVVESGLIDTLLTPYEQVGDMDFYLQFHTENETMRGFTGVTPTDRARAVGYDGAWVGENGNTGSDLINSTVAWFFSVYHRRPWLLPEVQDVGLAAYPRGEDRRVAVTMKYGSPGRPSDTDPPSDPAAGPPFVVLPAPGEENVPASWSGIEAPDPMPYRSRRADGVRRSVGPPISVFTPDGRAGEGELLLHDASGGRVGLHTVEASSDPRYLEVIPTSPLVPAATYSAVYSGPSGQFEWSFRTAPLPPGNTIASTPAAELAESARSILGAEIPEAEGLYMAQTASLRYEARGQTLEIEPYGYTVDLPLGFAPSLNPDAPWLVRLELADPWAAVDIVFHRLGDQRDLAWLWEQAFPRHWEWPYLGDKDVVITDEGGTERRYRSGRWDMGNGRTARIHMTIHTERGLSLWSYGLDEGEAEQILKGVAARPIP